MFLQHLFACYRLWSVLAAAICSENLFTCSLVLIHFLFHNCLERSYYCRQRNSLCNIILSSLNASLKFQTQSLALLRFSAPACTVELFSDRHLCMTCTCSSTVVTLFAIWMLLSAEHYEQRKMMSNEVKLMITFVMQVYAQTCLWSYLT